MIVVINPSGKAGHSFQGLHAYCSHDPDRAKSSDRVEWIETRNIAANDPEDAWKVMVATAQAQNVLKHQAGVRAGRKSSQGAVLHVILSFDEEEPQDRDSMTAAADEFLSHLGVDPAKMRGKSKPKRRQFANEHQSMMYVHGDTGHKHIHLMINRVHPETGVNLPSNNDQLKAQKWALDYSKRHGTDHKTPARAENNRDRDNGEYVKANRRKLRNAFELDQALNSASNDNELLKTEMDKQRKKDAELAQSGRNLKAMQSVQWEQLTKGHKQRVASLRRNVQKRINKHRSAVREAFRPQWRELSNRQVAEQTTFDALEKTLFGRAGNIAKTVKLSNNLLRERPGSIISRTFRILTNAAKRKEYFLKSQRQQRRALAREQKLALEKGLSKLKSEHAVKLEENRKGFKREKSALEAIQAVEGSQLKQRLKKRSQDRVKALQTAMQSTSRNNKLDHRGREDRQRYMREFDKARRGSARGRKNRHDRGDGQER